MNEDLESLFGVPIPHREEIGFYLDENVDQRVVTALRERGITVITMEEEGMKGEKDDRMPLVRATQLGYVLVTGDQDFGQINEQINELWPDAHHAGIIFISSPKSPGRLIDDLVRIHKDWTPERMHNLFLPI